MRIIKITSINKPEEIIFDNKGYSTKKINEALNWAENYAHKNWEKVMYKTHEGEDRLFTNQYLCNPITGDCLVFERL